MKLVDQLNALTACASDSALRAEYDTACERFAGDFAALWAIREKTTAKKASFAARHDTGALRDPQGAKPTPREQFLYDVLTTAIEGGIGYWARVRKLERDAELNVLRFEARDAEDGSAPYQSITPEKIDAAIARVQRGSVKVGQSYAAQFVGYPENLNACDVDAIGADIVVQVAAFGEIVFG